jgi:putative two-component system response regulator
LMKLSPRRGTRFERKQKCELAIMNERLGNALRPDAHILIVDDEPTNVLLLQRILKSAGYTRVSVANDGYAAIAQCQSESFDLVLLDLMMPGCDGFGVLERLARQLEDEQLPVMMLTADVSRGAKQRALDMGAKDFLTKPLDGVEVLLRVKNLLETRFLNLELREQNRHLEQRVAERTQALSESYDRLAASNAQLKKSQRAVEDSQMEVLNRLAQAAELRDDDTGQHTHRVGELACRMATHLGVDCDHVELIRQTAPLHDVGKIGISDTILLKPGRLTPEEFAVMKTHTIIGAQLLSAGQSPFMRMAEVIALSHHERFDGNGYPNGLTGDDIPLEGRIVSVADVFDALTHERPYKRAWSPQEALDEIQKGAGTQFDPDVVKAFLEVACSP